jgi:hypothetical protein
VQQEQCSAAQPVQRAHPARHPDLTLSPGYSVGNHARCIQHAGFTIEEGWRCSTQPYKGRMQLP